MLERLPAPDDRTGKPVSPLRTDRPVHRAPLPAVRRQAAGSGAGGHALPPRLQAGVERLAGLGLDGVTVHRASPRPSRIGALAYTAGDDIYLGPGQDAHLAHEAWHVVQQRQGRVRPTATVGGVEVNDDAALEREADQRAGAALAVGRSAVAAAPAGSGAGPTTRIAPAAPVAQGVFTEQQKQRIANMSHLKRIRVLAQARDEDLQSYYDSAYHDANYLAAEESDEIRARRRAAGVRRPTGIDADIDALIDRMGALSLVDDDADEPVTDVEEDESDVRVARDDADDAMVTMTDVDGLVDIEMTDVHGGVNIQVDDVHGELDMEIEHVTGWVDVTVTNVSGHVHISMSDIALRPPEPLAMEIDDPRAAELDAMDIDVHDVAGAMDVDMSDVGEPMDLDLGPVASEEQLRRGVKRPRADRDATAPLDPDLAPPSSKRRRLSPDAERAVPTASSSGVPSESSGDDLDRELDTLITGMRSLTLSFQTPDGENHELYPAEDASDVIVESNPVPLASIIARGKWHAVVLAPAVLTTLRTLRAAAKTALAAYATNRSQVSGNDLRKALRAIAKQLALPAGINLPPTDLSNSTYYGSNGGKTEGKRLRATPLSLNSKMVGHGPSKDGRLMTAIRKAAPGKEGSLYKQMHLLNDNVFGPGRLWNLTPGPTASNNTMERQVETPLKRAIIDKGKVINLDVVVSYKFDPVAASDSDIDQNPNKYRFDRITFSATQLTTTHGTTAYVAKGANTDPDIRSVDGAVVRWDWGNLTPLVPKPKILSTTDADELINAGLPKAVAERIVAYNTKKAPYTLTGKNKKEQLADLVKAFDHKRRMGTSWDAGAVLWS